jgi:hypothetical protein
MLLNTVSVFRVIISLNLKMLQCFPFTPGLDWDSGISIFLDSLKTCYMGEFQKCNKPDKMVYLTLLNTHHTGLTSSICPWAALALSLPLFAFFLLFYLKQVLYIIISSPTIFPYVSLKIKPLKNSIIQLHLTTI